MFLAKKHLSRRTLLKSVGVTLGLPFLDAMAPAQTPLAQPTLRAGFVYVPNGAVITRWANEILKPLDPFRSHLNVVSGLSLPMSAPSAHAQSSGMWLNSAALRPGELKASTTADQLIAQRIGQTTPLPSLELATEDVSGAVGACEGNIDCTFLNTLCWRTPVTPLPMEINPRAVFERLFGEGNPQETASILDGTLASMKSLSTGLGARDKARLDQYFENIREVERRIQNTQKNQAKLPTGPLPQTPIGIPASFEEHINLMFDLIHLAWSADITRVSTFMMARELSPMTYPWIGVPDPHHAISHHQYNPVLMDKLTKINTYHAQLFARFIGKLAATPDGTGTLLDHSMILYGGGMRDGNGHTHDNLPLSLIGGGAGTIKGGRTLQLKENTKMSNLLVSMMTKADVHESKFADSDGSVDL